MVIIRLKVVAVVMLGLALGFAPACAKESARDKVVDQKASAREGRRLFLELNCMSCHSVAGQGGTSAPGLDGIGKRRTRKFIQAKIRDPQAHKRVKSAKSNQKNKLQSGMIQADLFGDQIKALTDYLLTLKDKK